ncbi:unnamed protein product [Rhizophagus irregularis]|nr:unnamed protein product [Rhizophagus irregularis]CAB5215181.1 unnamed protein product [Rhizophagus irregularis]
MYQVVFNEDIGDHFVSYLEIRVFTLYWTNTSDDYYQSSSADKQTDPAPDSYMRMRTQSQKISYNQKVDKA